MRCVALAAALCITASSAVAVSFQPPAGAIVDGQKAKQVPGFVGSMISPDATGRAGIGCPATLIARRWAVTAGHCVGPLTDAKSGRPTNWSIRFGSRQAAKGGELVAVTAFVRRSMKFTARSDVALLRLARAPKVKPARIATSRPSPGDTVRMMGWGLTTADSKGFKEYDNPRYYPRYIREASASVRDGATCEKQYGEGSPALCIGGDGDPSPNDRDSGGPALVKGSDGTWEIAGTVNGGNIGDPILYASLDWNRRWIDSYLSGDKPVPDKRLEYKTAPGTARVSGCSGSVARLPDSKKTDRAMALTNAHCLSVTPKPGKALLNRDPDRIDYLDRNVKIAAGVHAPRVFARIKVLLYATLTGTDVAVFALNKTYGELSNKGAEPLTLAETGPGVGDKLRVLDSANQAEHGCQVDRIVPRLREKLGSSPYDTTDVIRSASSPTCAQGSGSSGSAIVRGKSRKVVGIHNTSYNPGKPCAAGTPCEVRTNGRKVVVPGAVYGQQTAGLIPCLRGSRLTPDTPGCDLAGLREKAAD